MKPKLATILLVCYLQQTDQQLFGYGLRLWKTQFGQDTINEAPNATVCLGALGCFNNGPPFFDEVLRPVSLLPFRSRSDLDVKFQLFSKKSPNRPQDVYKFDRVVDKSSFDPEHKTIVVIHGLIDAVAYGPWIRILKDEILKKGNFNVIVTDWARANRLPYEQAIANGRAVGAEVALMVNKLIEVTGAKAEMFHLIGHSLGCHVAGFAGERIANLGRITGLDPAGPLFNGAPTQVRLDTTDATFVDVIHTNGGLTILSGLGALDAMGHIDFYPNGGKHQPGCTPKRLFKRSSSPFGTMNVGFRKMLACDHLRAVELFIESINNGQTMAAVQCYDYPNFVKGRCADCGPNGHKCAVFGYNVIQRFTPQQNRKSYFLTTNEKYPFRLHHSQIAVTLDKTNTSWTSGQGQITLLGDAFKYTTKLGSKSQLFSPGQSYSHLITTNSQLVNINKLIFNWQGEIYVSKWASKPANQTTVQTDPFIYVKHITLTSLEVDQLNNTRRFCVKDIEPLSPATDVVLTMENCK